eukprot:788724_1
MVQAQRYYENLYNEKNPIKQYSKQRLQELLNESYNDDTLEQNDEYTMDELKKIQPKLIKTKATGLDRINYTLIKRMIVFEDTAIILLDVINIIQNATILPSQLKVEKITMLKKKDHVTTFRHFRGITISQNMKSLISKLRYQRTKKLYDQNTHPNDAAYRTGCGTETLAYAQHICVVQVVKKNEIALIGQTDLNQAFDNCNRIKLIFDAHNQGIKGRNLRILADDITNKNIRMSYKQLFTDQFITTKGLPQGGDDSGPLFNGYTKQTTMKMLRLHSTMIYNYNMSTTNYSDDRLKICNSKQELQDMYLNEEYLNNLVNFSTNALKSKVIIYAKSQEAIQQIKQQIICNTIDIEEELSENIKLNGDTIHFENKPIKNLGIWRDYTNLRDPTSYHIEYKLEKSNNVRKKMYSLGLVGGDLDIEAQKDNWLKKIRPAMSYGLRVIRIKPKHYKQLDRIQSMYLSTIFDGPLSSDKYTTQILMGIPSWTTFILKTKLKYYYNVFKNQNSRFDEIIKCNYLEAHQIHKNNNKFKERDYWNYNTLDYVDTLLSFGLDPIYRDIEMLPSTLKQWQIVINRRYKKIYWTDFEKWITKQGWIFAQLVPQVKRFIRNKPYKNLIPLLKQLFDKSILSTPDIGQISLIAFNWHRISYINKHEWTANNKKCVFCNRTRNTSTAQHIIMNSDYFEFETKWEYMNTEQKIEILKQIQIEANNIIGS